MKHRMHVLHIGKTGGSAVSTALTSFCLDGKCTLHGHDTTLRQVPIGDRVAFFVRDPVARFISGFNSRLRKGAPRNYVEWTSAEERAFSKFRSPSSLAEGLISSEEELRAAAFEAMRSIYHPARHLSYWLHSLDYLKTRQSDIIFIGSTEHLDIDFRVLARIFRCGDSVSLPLDPIGRHMTPTGFETSLSAVASKTIQNWYRDDYPIFEFCLQVRAQIIKCYPEINAPRLFSASERIKNNDLEVTF